MLLMIMNPKMMFKKIIIILLMSLIFIPLCFAENISFQVEVDRNTIHLGQAIQATLRVTGTKDVPALKLPEIEGFEVAYAGGPYTQFSWVNGNSTSSVSYKYSLFPLKAGKFQIPSLTINLNGESYASEAIMIDVLAEETQGKQSPGSPQNISGDISDRMMLLLEADRQEVYLHEFISIKVLLLVNNLQIEYGEFPEFNNAGISIEKKSEAKQYQTTVNGMQYNVVEFNLVVMPTREGEITLGPAQLGCNILVRDKRDSFFGRGSMFGSSLFDSMFDSYQRIPRTLKSNEITLKVLPLPKEGQPENFQGAVGEFNFEAEIGPETVKVGDPITVKMMVSGSGNWEELTLPTLSDNEAFKVYEPIINIQAGRKTLEQVIIPKKDDIDKIPELEFSYFDVKAKEYKTIKRGPFPVEVLKLAEGEQMKIVGLQSQAVPREEVLGQDIVFIKKSLGRMYKKGKMIRNAFLIYFIFFSALLIWLGLIIYYKRTQKLKTDIAYAKKLHAPIYARKGLRQAFGLLHKEETADFYDILFKTFNLYLVNKFHLPKGSVSFETLKEVLQDKVSDKKILDTIRIIFEECDIVRYSSVNIQKEEKQKSYQRLQYIIDYLETHIK